MRDRKRETRSAGLTPLVHPHTSTRRGNVSLKATAAQLTEPNESGLNFTPSCPPTDTHTRTHARSPSRTHLNRPAEAAWALPQQGAALCCSRNWKSVITALIGRGVFSQTFPSSHQHFILPLTSRKTPPAVLADARLFIFLRRDPAVVLRDGAAELC